MAKRKKYPQLKSLIRLRRGVLGVIILMIVIIVVLFYEIVIGEGGLLAWMTQVFDMYQVFSFTKTYINLGRRITEFRQFLDDIERKKRELVDVAGKTLAEELLREQNL